PIRMMFEIEPPLPALCPPEGARLVPQRDRLTRSAIPAARRRTGMSIQHNSMINFYPYAGHPNSIAPRKGRTGGMAPTLVYQGNKLRLVLGSPGATRIITSNLQVILNVLDFGMRLTDAVLAPRFHCQGDIIRCQARIPEYVCTD